MKPPARATPSPRKVPTLIMRRGRGAPFSCREDVASDRAEQDSREDRVRQTLSYHHRTKHHLHRYAQGPGHLDWATQPDPFRTYAGAPATELPLLADALPASYGDLYITGRILPRRLDVNSLAILFELSL